MRYKVLQFWSKLDRITHLPLKGTFLFFEKWTDVSFFYFMYRITILQYLKETFKVNHKISS